MKNSDVCEIRCIHEESVKEVKANMLKESLFQKISDDFKTLGDKTRIKILYALSKKELCVCDLSAIMEMTDSAISHQLRLLRKSNMVKFRKEGKMAYYSLVDEHVLQLIKMGHQHAEE
ncbi:MAG: transcriptional regulator [Methanobacterium sp. BRmetb2]|jgi:DNA-binding transcriptional ArsR family regulator|nr:MAG: transcriptional regulator [Methanobacterium sp. BRmetb2]